MLNICGTFSNRIGDPHFSLAPQSQETESILEKWIELVFLQIYVENQNILEPIFFYRASKCKQNKKQDSRTLYGPAFLPFCVIIIRPFLSWFKMQTFQNQTVLNCLQFVTETQISTVLLRERRVKNYMRHLNASYVVHVLRDFVTLCRKTQETLISLGNTTRTCLADCSLPFDRPPSIFPLRCRCT